MAGFLLVPGLEEKGGVLIERIFDARIR